MTDTAIVNEQAFYAAPTRKQLFWRWCGFRFHLGNDVAEGDFQGWTGWMQTRSQMHFGFVDRLRILITGRLQLQHTFHLDTPSPDKVHTRFDWQILPPGGDA